jgi:hypothetical protein
MAMVCAHVVVGIPELVWLSVSMLVLGGMWCMRHALQWPRLSLRAP